MKETKKILDENINKNVSSIQNKQFLSLTDRRNSSTRKTNNLQT